MNTTAASGDFLTLNCTVTGSEPIKYQWFKDGSELPGETRNVLELQPALPVDSGIYRCTALNSVRGISSREFVVSGGYYECHVIIDLLGLHILISKYAFAVYKHNAMCLHNDNTFVYFSCTCTIVCVCVYVCVCVCMCDCVWLISLSLPPSHPPSLPPPLSLSL